jgi:hypothetical protein
MNDAQGNPMPRLLIGRFIFYIPKLQGKYIGKIALAADNEAGGLHVAPNNFFLFHTNPLLSG